MAASEAQTAAAHSAAHAAESAAAESAALAVAHQDVAASQSAVARRLADAPASTPPEALSTSRPSMAWHRVQATVQEAAAVAAGALARLWLWIRLWAGDVRLLVVQMVGDAQAWVSQMTRRK